MKLLEDVNKVLSRGSSTKPAVGMGFAGGSAGGSKSQDRGRFGQAVCFKCGATGHISRRCCINPQNISKDDKENAAAALEKYNESPARKAWLEEKKKEGEKRTNFGAISCFKAQGVLTEDKFPVVRIVLENFKCCCGVRETSGE